MILGVRAHDYGKTSVEELAKRIAAKGFTSVQLPLSKAIAGIDTGLGRLNPGMASYIRDVFAAHNLKIALLGCYIHLVHSDPQIRRQGLERFKEHLRYARDFGCSIVGTESGSVNPGDPSSPNHTEEAFQTLVDSVTELVTEAEKFGVMVGIEGVAKETLSSPEKIKLLIDIVKSNNLQIIFDPFNLITADNYQSQDEIYQKSFELFGDRIVIIHAKDFIVENGKVQQVPVGKGMLNYELLLKLIKTRKPYINVMLEGAAPETAVESGEFLKTLYEKV